MLSLKKLEKPTQEKKVKLGDVPKGQGNLVRFANIPFEEALKENAFYWVVEGPPTHKDLVTLMPVDGKAIVLRDTAHEVVVHEYEVQIAPSQV